MRNITLSAATEFHDKWVYENLLQNLTVGTSMHELNFKNKNQRQIRKKRRKANAAGFKNAFK